jgi:uncharacterized protein
MQIQRHPITAAENAAGTELISLHFGSAGTGKKVYIQAALHADEVPGLLVAQFLRKEFLQLEADGLINGEIILVPAANPLGLSQALLGVPFGRFDFTTGINFNREYENIAPSLLGVIDDLLGDDEQKNVQVVREHARQAIAEIPTKTNADELKKTLLGLAIDADIVLDLHCDNEAVLHLYTSTPFVEAIKPLSCLLGAHAVLISPDTGECPFDETCSRLWLDLAAHFEDRFPIPDACFSATVELRGERDVNYDLARADTLAIIDFLALSGSIDKPIPSLPDSLCQPTPLEGVEPVLAPHSGILVFNKALGENVQAGETLADLIDPTTGATTAICASVSGRFFARTAHRHLLRGMNIGKIAGCEAFRTQNLMSP